MNFYSSGKLIADSMCKKTMYKFQINIFGNSTRQIFLNCFPKILRLVEGEVEEEANGGKGRLSRRGGGANDAQRVVELASGFPEEDVLEVARQAVNEVEQMQENNSKPVSSSSSDRDGKNARATGGLTNGGEMKNVTTTSDMAGREQQQVSPTVVDDRVKTGSNALDQQHVNSGMEKSTIDSIEVAAKVSHTACPGDGEEVDQAMKVERTPERKSPALSGEEMEIALEANRGPVLVSSSVSQPIFNSAATDNSQWDYMTPQQPTEGTGHNDAAAAAVGGTPIAVLAATKGAFIPPASPIRIKGELGWKGSAATSAFRPAEPRQTPDRQHSNAESLASDANLSLNTNAVKRARPLLEFDLNVVDERVMEDAGVAAVTTLSSQGSVLGISLQNQSLPSSSVSGVTFSKQESPFLTFLNPESSSSAHPISNGNGSGSLQASHGQALPSCSGYGAMRPNLDLDLNRMDNSEEYGTPLPFSSDAQAAEAALINNMGPFTNEMFHGGPTTLSPSPAIVYHPPAERVAFNAYGPFPVFGGSTGFRPSSVPLPATTSAPFVDAASGPVPFPAMSSQLGSQPTVPSTYIRPPFLMGMPAEAAAAADNGSGGAWSIRSLDLNAGPELADADSTRDDMMHGRLLPLHPAAPAVFNEQMRANLSQVSGNSGLMMTPLKRKEPEGQWNCYTGNAGFKQATWQ
ncbi:unnamed protein product [Sphagnum troendelagicum]|uniref:Uncharacterized protein n=1 Tax=Sphagnum troendelagicum TaxID=128251 RepID=A0ABP0UKY8_9BRYO